MQTKSATINTCIYNITIKCHFGAKGLFQKTIKNKIKRARDIFTLEKRAYKIVHFCTYIFLDSIYCGRNISFGIQRQNYRRANSNTKRSKERKIDLYCLKPAIFAR